MISVGCLQTMYTLWCLRLWAERIPPLFIPPEVEMILSHSGAFPLCTRVFGVVPATEGPLLCGAGPPRPERQDPVST